VKLTRPQIAALDVLSQHGPCKTASATRPGFEGWYVNGVTAKALKRQGLVQYQPGSMGQIVEITAAGRAALAKNKTPDR
jgi:hypothetical protein